jgi:hypothetical protein
MGISYNLRLPMVYASVWRQVEAATPGNCIHAEYRRRPGGAVPA